ncbi:MAG: glycosyltransferase family 4 protein [Tumebacillaceae bacterium]
MRLGIVKPDYKIIGGFEIVVERIQRELQQRGWQVDVLPVDLTSSLLHHLPISVGAEELQANHEFYTYAAQMLHFRSLRFDGYDAILSTQPPSFAVKHPHHFSLLYHHHKKFYDLSEFALQLGLTGANHLTATAYIREMDTKMLQDVHVIAGSKHVRERLLRYNGLQQEIPVFYAGIDDDMFAYAGPVRYDMPICVGRHEFPKRPELFVHAMKLLPELTGYVVGVGGRTEDLQKADRCLTAVHQLQLPPIPSQRLLELVYLGKLGADERRLLKEFEAKRLESNVVFTGRASKTDLIERYASASCVVCPAYEEDYGLTAIEAMSFRKPVIACKDGGGYQELIIDGETGFVVDPTPEAIADAVRYLHENHGVAERMGQKAYERSREFTWAKAIDLLVETITQNR